LQNESAVAGLEARLALINMLVDAGLTRIECGSFVSPKRVPQMAETADLFFRLRRSPGVTYSALVPNLQGLVKAMECNVGEVAVFVSASETFSQKNINCTVEEGLRRVEEVLHKTKPMNLPVRGYVSCVLGCPFEEKVEISAVVDVARTLHNLGCREISLGDTIGVGTPLSARKMLEEVAEAVPVSNLAVHYHDTWGQALANILASLEVGISVIDSSVAGLGGCPYAPGATGNVATEDVIYMLDGMGIHTGVDLRKVATAGRMISSVLGRSPASKVSLALAACHST
jgi:hydroxymethylglutaryl-CoA lyase